MTPKILVRYPAGEKLEFRTAFSNFLKFEATFKDESNVQEVTISYRLYDLTAPGIDRN